MVLTHADDKALEVTEDARSRLHAASQGPARPFADLAPGNDLADPRSVAAAVTAQVQALTPALAEAGALSCSCINSPNRLYHR